MKTFAGVVILIAAAGGAIFWFLTQPVTWLAPEGYEVSVPHGWEVKPVEGGMSAGSPLENGPGSASASFHPFSGRGRPAWPDAALAHYGARPEEYKTDEIDGRPAVFLIFQESGSKYAAAVVDRGDGLVAFKIGCPTDTFDPKRPLFERMVRRIKCARPKP
jgi:hypothetical protein